jgi:hypothetical protein
MLVPKYLDRLEPLFGAVLSVMMFVDGKEVLYLQLHTTVSVGIIRLV